MRPSTRSKHNRQRATEDHHVHAPQSRLSYLTMVLYFWKDRRSHSRNRAYTKTCYQTPKIQVRCFKYTRFKSACSKKLDQTQLRTSWSYPTATEHKAGHDAITGHASEVGSWDGAINSCVPRHNSCVPRLLQMADKPPSRGTVRDHKKLVEQLKQQKILAEQVIIRPQTVPSPSKDAMCPLAGTRRRADDRMRPKFLCTLPHILLHTALLLTWDHDR